MRSRFPAAAWSGLLKSMSLIVTLLLVSAGYVVEQTVPAVDVSLLVATLAGCGLPAIALVALLFVVIDYEIDDNQLRIRRLLWHTRIDLSSVVAAHGDPTALQGSVRTAGNGGLFSFIGYYRNQQLGAYEAYVTDWKRAVVVGLSRRVIVVSPADPASFVLAVQSRLPRPGNLR